MTAPAPVRLSGYPDRPMGRSDELTRRVSHEHTFVVYDDSKAAPRSRQPASFRQVWARCSCGLEERRRYSGPLIELRYRLPGTLDWVDPVMLVELRFDHLIVCPRCEGQRYDYGSCSLCGSLGVLDEEGLAVA